MTNILHPALADDGRVYNPNPAVLRERRMAYPESPNFAAMRAGVKLAVIVFFCTGGIADGQTPNPFELLWRKGSTAPEVRPTPTPVTPDTPVTFIGDTLSLTPLSEVPAESFIDILPVDDTPPVADVPYLPDPDSAVEKITDTLLYAPALPDTQSAIGIDREAIPPAPPSDTGTSGIPAILLVIFFTVTLSILALALALNRDLLQNVYRAAFNENFSSLLYREQRFATTQYLYYIMYLTFFLNGGLFFYYVAGYFDLGSRVLSSLWLCIALVGVVYLIRHLVMGVLARSFPLEKEVTHFSFNIVLYNILAGIGLIPVNLFLAFGPAGVVRIFILTGLALCVLVYLMRQARGLLIGSKLISTSPFHFFLYLCAIEILPAITLVKLFHN